MALVRTFSTMHCNLFSNTPTFTELVRTVQKRVASELWLPEGRVAAISVIAVLTSTVLISTVLTSTILNFTVLTTVSTFTVPTSTVLTYTALTYVVG